MAYVDKIDVEGTTYDLGALESFKDSNGNLRFIEGNGTITEPSGLTVSYKKWSLSGTHLMLVLAGSISDGTTIANDTLSCTYTLPSWVANKIYPVWSNNIERKSTMLIDSSWGSQEIYFYTNKSGSNLIIKNSGNISNSSGKTRYFRIQFDLLIDTE